ncbi:bifunctional DNA primase/polymerase [Mycobacterium sp. MBM]|nr:bifunctional DNA primase/polymerase [Mycobacterium sp. MBM]
MTERKAPAPGGTGTQLSDQTDNTSVADVREELTALATMRVVFRPEKVTPGLLLASAIVYAQHGWKVFPLRGKVPAIRGGHGVLDATDDLATVCRWWAVEYPGANIGVRVPDGVFVLDTDPRKDGHAAAAAALAEAHGSFPRTLTHLSGRIDGGMHRFYRHPGGKLTTERLGPGFDIKDSSGYVVAPPSVHPDSGWPYVELLDMLIADCGWLAPLIVAEPMRDVTARSTTAMALRPAPFWAGPSIADTFTQHHSWTEVLEPHGWRCRSGDPDADGAVWLHPHHTSNCSATVSTDGRLYVYSTSTAFEVTEPGSPRGYSRFDAYAVLNFGGDASAAARALRRAG